VSDEPIPIREGVVPEFDLEREMLDFVQLQLNIFRNAAGVPPTRIAVVVMGKDKSERFTSRTRTWDTKNEVGRIENAAIASTLFLHNAIGDR
jgi:hypothetical protein